MSMKVFQKTTILKRFLMSVSLIILWILFSLGPLNIFGNNLFGDPRFVDSWFLGLPSIWIWQLISWGLGIIIIWTIAYKLKFSKIVGIMIFLMNNKKTQYYIFLLLVLFLSFTLC